MGLHLLPVASRHMAKLKSAGIQVIGLDIMPQNAGIDQSYVGNIRKNI